MSDWQEIDRLIDEQKYAEASELVKAARESARAAGDESTWTRAVIREAQLRTALHGYESAVELLRAQPRAEAPRSRALLDLFYAYGLLHYTDAYSWEIRQRERLDRDGGLELKTATLEQIVEEANAAFARVWAERAEAWAAAPLDDFSEYLRPNNYPERIRGSLRDAVSYLWVELLANTGYWRASESNGVYRLSLEGLIADDTPAGADAHPLERIAFILSDLERWHLDAGRSEAASEARLERLRRLHVSWTRSEDRQRLRRALEEHLDTLGKKLPWWSMGQALLAEWHRAEAGDDSLARAHAVATAGAQAHPQSFGGKRCAHLVGVIEAPGLRMDAMAVDGPARRSVRVQHKNLERLHLRAYRFDAHGRLVGSRDRSHLPNHRELRNLLARSEPVAEWVEELPPTPDYREHTSWVTPPLAEPGGYVLVASSRADFHPEDALVSAVPILVGDLVLVRRQMGSRLEVTVRSGSSGRPVEGAEVSLWLRNYREAHSKAARERTATDGIASFELDPEARGYFVVASKDGQTALDTDYLYAQHDAEQDEVQSSLTYTDRSVYRPGQEVLWKLVAYRGRVPMGEYEILEGRKLTVELLDPNGEAVDRVEVETNAFGSAAGRFRLPLGRRLGHWSLRSELGWAPVRVEEYKRPTFEVSIDDPETPLRLNRTAQLTGEARYYFGLPVSAGTVEWRVEREAVLPYWWWRPIPNQVTESIAGGTAELNPDGRFEVEFLPEADERQSADRGVTYRYRLSVDVTDEGGETRSDARAFRLGFVSVEARLTSDVGFHRSGEPVQLRVVRSDLDGRPVAGEGRWRLLAVERPEKTDLPADQPALDGDETGYLTEGDRLRPRWAPALARERVQRRWPDGRQLAAGAIEHASTGEATVDLGSLAPGVYRLRYATEDDFGATFELQEEIVVAAPRADRLELPAVLIAERASVSVGDVARLYVDSGLDDQELLLEVYRDGARHSLERLESGEGPHLIEIPIDEELRGGFGVHLTALRDHQLMTSSTSVFVPWDDRKLAVEFASFRDRLRPGQRERWTVKLSGADGEALSRGSAEMLAYMYDRSLDLFAPHRPPNVQSLYPRRVGHWHVASTLGEQSPIWQRRSDLSRVPGYTALSGDVLRFFDGYPIGGPGRRRMLAKRAMAVTSEAPALAEPMADSAEMGATISQIDLESIPTARDPWSVATAGEPPADALREDFSETAFWEPQLVVEDDGTVAFEFEVPDSLTEWSVWVHALTRDLRGGSIERSARSAKELMVRPYLPRFLREGDRTALRVTVNNGSESELAGVVDLDILDPESRESLLGEFGLSPAEATGRTFSVAAGGGTTVEFALEAPVRVGEVAFEVRARAGDLSDGELRPLPLLPGRMHLSQSRFAALQDADRRELTFADLLADDDPTRIDEQLVVTLDAQLFYSVLNALPYLAEYPYECTEQTLNRFLSTGIVSTLYERYPAVARMARQLSERETRLESWAGDDPNRKMSLEETPWLRVARGGADDDLINVLDPRIAQAQRDIALAKLEEAQTSLGGFPWWPGGPPSPYMTLYLVYGFSKALEFDLELPREMVAKAWSYLRRHWEEELRDLAEGESGAEFVTFLNYVLSNYPDPSWTGDLFSEADRAQMLEVSFEHWREHSPLLKGYLALTLAREGRPEDAELVWDSVMDSARTTRDEGTFWAAEERSWLWYNDSIESHAFALRVLTELEPDDERRHGLVQWLLMNKKLNHWKSTRATAEVIYALVHYLEREGQLGAREAARVSIGSRVHDFVFEPDAYTGRKNQIVLTGDEIEPRETATTVVEKETAGLLFASATWHFSTERLPETGSGDLFAVERRLFRRLREGGEWVLRPLRDGERLEVGDQVEVHLEISARHAAEYIHLRDPRAAGFEPESQRSGYRWDLGIGRYEEIRDSGTNFFFDRLPVGSYTLKYRVRAAAAGIYRVAPATLQSMYAPEFTGYSAGSEIEIGG